MLGARRLQAVEDEAEQSMVFAPRFGGARSIGAACALLCALTGALTGALIGAAPQGCLIA
eukprot:6709195-Prymnesium_polylepis.1